MIKEMYTLEEKEPDIGSIIYIFHSNAVGDRLQAETVEVFNRKEFLLNQASKGLLDDADIRILKLMMLGKISPYDFGIVDEKGQWTGLDLIYPEDVKYWTPAVILDPNKEEVS